MLRMGVEGFWSRVLFKSTERLHRAMMMTGMFTNNPPLDIEALRKYVKV